MDSKCAHSRSIENISFGAKETKISIPGQRNKIIHIYSVMLFNLYEVINFGIYHKEDEVRRHYSTLSKVETTSQTLHDLFVWGVWSSQTQTEKAPGVSCKLVLGEYSLGIEGYGVIEYEKCSDDGWQYFSRLWKCLSSLTIHQKLVKTCILTLHKA